jgi:hypothetical protein
MATGHRHTRERRTFFLCVRVEAGEILHGFLEGKILRCGI